MAAATELSFLLFALINHIHAEEHIVVFKERVSIRSMLPKDYDSCLLSRFVGEEKLVLWNTSDVWSQNSTLPEDLKQRLSVDSQEDIYSVMIQNLTHSDSGLYQEECWTDGNVTYEENTSVIVICSTETPSWIYDAGLGDTMELPCPGAADSLDIQWLKRDYRYKQEMWTRDFGDRYQVVKNTSALRIANTTITHFGEYMCLVMNQQQQCVSGHLVEYYLHTETIYGSEEETAVLLCDGSDSTDDKPPRWINMISKTVLGQDNHTVPSVDQNYSLVFPSLLLNHSAVYSCETSGRPQVYELVVCPEFGPPAVKLFSEGEDVTLTCKDSEKGLRHVWFINLYQTEGRNLNVRSHQSRLSRVRRYHHNASLVISDMSQKDSGEYWCAVTDQHAQCVSTTTVVLWYRDPFGVHSTFYTVRCSVLSVLLLMLCVVVVAVNQWARRIVQL